MSWHSSSGIMASSAAVGFCGPEVEQPHAGKFAKLAKEAMKKIALGNSWTASLHSSEPHRILLRVVLLCPAIEKE
jgi:hypothetical protein